MSETRLKVKFGDHEFEAEGPAESVERQFAAFKQLILPGSEPSVVPPAQPTKETGPAQLPLDKIMQLNGQSVALRVAAEASEAVLLILLGLRELRGRYIVSGRDIMDGLRASGAPVRRADIILKGLAASGAIVAIGKHRMLRYQFSATGLTRAQQIAANLVAAAEAQVPSSATGE